MEIDIWKMNMCRSFFPSKTVDPQVCWAAPSSACVARMRSAARYGSKIETGEQAIPSGYVKIAIENGQL